MINPGSAQTAHPQSGFSLIQLSLLLTALGLVAVTMLPGAETGTYTSRMQVSHERMMRIEQAAQGFMAANGRRPCPADATVDVGAAAFGREAATPGSCAGGTPAANFDGTGANANVVGGGVPNVALGLPDEYAFDGFGNRITYVVDRRATAKASCITLQGGGKPKPGNSGDIEIRDAASSGNLISNTMWTLISHGADAHGAFPMQGQGAAGGGSLSNRLNTGNTGVDTLKNASVDSSFAAAFSKVFVKKERTLDPMPFDDLTWYAESTKNTCCVGAVCSIPGFRIDGVANDRLGWSMVAADFNGDGKDDLVFSGGSNTYVLYGRSSRNFASPLRANTLSAPEGSIINRTGGRPAGNGNDTAGYYMPVNINGDSLADLLLLHATTNCSNGTVLSVLLGGTNEWQKSSIDVNALAGSGTGFVVSGSPCYSVASADLNNDGYRELILGNQNGRVLILYGKANGWGSSGFYSSGTPATPYLSITKDPGQSYCWALGGSMTTGDFNGDGFQDLYIGNGQGCSFKYSEGYIVFGSASLPANTTLNITDLNNVAGFGGTRLLSPDTCCDWHGAFVSAASGDIDHDGVDDLIIGSVGAGPFPGGSWPDQGAMFVVFGSAGMWPASEDLANLAGSNVANPPGRRGIVLQGSSYTYRGQPGNLTKSIDINNDGYSDILFQGSPISTYVIHGKSNWSGTVFDLATKIDGTTGYRLEGNGNNAVFEDINNDGLRDFILTDENSGAKGGAHVVFGKAGPWSPYFAASSVNGGNGFAFDASNNANQKFGFRAVTLDIDGDGTRDIAISAPYANFGGTNAGSVYVMFGRPSPKKYDATYPLADF